MYLRKYNEQELKDAISTSVSIRESLIKLNLVPYGGNYRTIKKAIEHYKIDTSHFTGQNILSLSNHADFVKPMYYRRTYAPAGIPFEIKSYSQSFTKQKYFEITEKFFKIIGQNVKNQENISDEYMEQELICLKSNFGIKNICAGLEFNQIENIAPTNKVYLKHSLKSFYNAKIDGIVLSWDLMSIPYEHLTAYIESRQQNESKNSDSGGGCK